MGIRTRVLNVQFLGHCSDKCCQEPLLAMWSKSETAALTDRKIFLYQSHSEKNHSIAAAEWKAKKLAASVKTADK